MSKAVTLTAPDNGGKLVVITLTYGTAIDSATNNAEVNKILCLFAREFMVVQERVNDEFGGFCGAPSQYMPTTGNATLRLL